SALRSQKIRVDRWVTVVHWSYPGARSRARARESAPWWPVGIQLRHMEAGDIQGGIEATEDAERRGHQTLWAVAPHEGRIDHRAARHPARQLVDDGLPRPAYALSRRLRTCGCNSRSLRARHALHRRFG